MYFCLSDIEKYVISTTLFMVGLEWAMNQSRSRNVLLLSFSLGMFFGGVVEL
jgi:hypothetical protein